MIARNAGPFAAICNTFSPAAAIKSSTSSSRGTRPWTSRTPHAHHYGTAAGSIEDESPGPARPAARDHIWPQPTKGNSCPTPYQIFELEQRQQYNKARFYELVKIYHPDLSSGKDGGGSGGGMSHETRLERYRLIVAAHTILSDPVKRSAYDRFGSGWSGKAEVKGRHAWGGGAAGAAEKTGPFSHSWQGDPNDPIWQNATWEDWERWHDRRAGTHHEPVYMRNGYFITCVAVLAIIGSSLNYNRAQDAGTYFVEQRDLVHDRAAKELRRVRQEKSGFNTRQDRIDFFVRQREATMGTSAFDTEAMREERASRFLPEKDICRSEEVSETEP